MLNIKTRQAYLKELGLYDGDIDGIAGKKTRAAYKALQEKYFTREKDIDGIYGKNTEILLINAYRVNLYAKDFKLNEFRCKCGKYCTGYPSLLDVDLIKNLQKIRDEYGATTITSGLRCEKHNKAVGGASNSRHKQGKAADIRNTASRLESGRKAIMRSWELLPQQRYTYCNIGGNYPGMGEAVHVDVK